MSTRTIDDDRLHARLAALADDATGRIELLHPSDGEVVAVTPPRRAPRGRGRTVAALVAAAAAVALVGVAVWGPGGRTATPAASGALAAGPPIGGTRSAADRLRDAIDATLASESFQVRTEHVEVGFGLHSAGVGGASELPAVVSAGPVGDLISTVQGHLVSRSWTSAAARPSVVRDESTGQTYWQVASGEWQQASFDEPSITDQLRDFASASCVDQPDMSDDRTITVTVGAPDGCVDEVDGSTVVARRWTVTLRSDGRIDTIRPDVADGSADLDAGSAQTFSGYDASTVTLPDASLVTRVPAPVSSTVDPATGFARPLYTKG